MNKEKASAKVDNPILRNEFFQSTLDGEWFLQPALPSDTAVGKLPFIRFNSVKKTFTGNNGCNSMSGSFTTNNSSLAFSSAITTTKMLCTGYNEKAFMDNLARTNQYKIVNSVLVFMNNGTELSKWTRKVTPEPKAQKI